VVELSREGLQEYQPSGSPNRYAPGQVSVYNDEVDHLVSPEGVTDTWNRYDYTRVITETQVLTADPGQILAGGAMRLTADSVHNDKSRIIAGAILTANLGSLINTAQTGVHTLVDAGSASNFFRIQQKGRDHQGINTATYAPPATIQAITVRAAVYEQNTTASGSGTQIAGFSASNLTQSAPGAGAANVALTRAAVVNSTLSNNSLFITNPNPAASFLVETDPRFASYRTWLSSDYLLQQLNLDPAHSQKRLGDGFYEQKLVREQVAQLTGRRFLDGYANDEAQYRALIDNGVTVARQWNLRPGVALSAEQVAQLTSDIVWLVEKDVTLPNGQVTKVLAPQVYARVQRGDLDGFGALLSGSAVNLNLTGDAFNSGTIAGRTVVALTAENLNNLGGRISAAQTILLARTDLNNIGGRLEAGNSLSVSAGRDLNVASTSRDTQSATGTRANIDRVAGLYVTDANGTLLASAGRDLSLIAATVSNLGQGGSTTLIAGNNLSLGTLTQSSQNNIVWDAANYRKDGSRSDVGTTIKATGNIGLSAGNDLSLKAALVSSDHGALALSAGRNVSLTAGQTAQSMDEAHRVEGSNGWLSKKTTTTRDTLSETSALGTTLSGESIDLRAGQALSAQAANVAGTCNVCVQAGTDINIAAGQKTRSESLVVTEKQSGLSASFTSLS
jgi:filamentous hemagglutinin